MKFESIITTLSKKGVLTLQQQSEKEVACILEHLGKVIYVTDVKINPKSKALVTSSKALDFHTDHHNAKWILWHCLKQTDIGGESMLIDAIQAYQKLGDDDKKTLSQIMLFEHNIFEDDKNSCPLVQEEHGTLKFYYSFWMVDKNMPESQKNALMNFRAIIAKETPVKLKLEKGDVLIIDNHRILHGRCEIKGHQNRFLKRFWIQ